jgi:hypothetical protein
MLKSNPTTVSESEGASEETLMPFAEREYVSMRRAMSILGVSEATLSRLVADGVVQWFNLGKTTWKRVRYQSLIEFCDQLRQQHKIESRRPPLGAPYLRYRDEDLLPFPLSDTIPSAEACAALGYIKTPSVVLLIEEGRFDAYQLVQRAPWRISRSSLLVFINRSRTAHTNKRGGAHKGPLVSPHF